MNFIYDEANVVVKECVPFQRDASRFRRAHVWPLRARTNSMLDDHTLTFNEFIVFIECSRQMLRESEKVK